MRWADLHCVVSCAIASGCSVGFFRLCHCAFCATRYDAMRGVQCGAVRCSVVRCGYSGWTGRGAFEAKGVCRPRTKGHIKSGDSSVLSDSTNADLRLIWKKDAKTHYKDTSEPKTWLSLRGQDTAANNYDNRAARLSAQYCRRSEGRGRGGVDCTSRIISVLNRHVQVGAGWIILPAEIHAQG